VTRTAAGSIPSTRAPCRLDLEASDRAVVAKRGRLREQADRGETQAAKRRSKPARSDSPYRSIVLQMLAAILGSSEIP